MTDQEVDRFVETLEQEQAIAQITDPSKEHTEVQVLEEVDVEALVKSSERFDKLKKYYDSLPWKVDMPVNLEWLEKNVAPLMDQPKEEAAEKGPLYSIPDHPIPVPYPFHPQESLKVTNPNAESGLLFYKCASPNCPVWCTSDTIAVVLPELTDTHPDVRAKICLQTFSVNVDWFQT